MRIGFMGEDYWAQHLAEGLNKRFPGSVDCRYVISYTNRHALRDTIRLLIQCDLIVRVGFPPTLMPTLSEPDQAHRTRLTEQIKHTLFRFRFGRAIRYAVLARRFGPIWRRRTVMDYLERWFPRRPGHRRSTIYYWIGTDVLQWLEQNQVGMGNAGDPRALGGPSITGASHLTAELLTIGIKARTVAFPGVILPPPEPIPAMPDDMVVVSYIPAEREDFYGLSSLLDAARALPDVQFRFFGGATGDGETPDNVEFLGRVDNTDPVYAQSSVVARIVRHDAVGATVMEGLLYARPVLYSFPLPHTIHVPHGDSDSLTSALRDLRQIHRDRGIPLNTEGHHWARVEFDVEHRFSQLHDTLVAVNSFGSDQVCE